MCRNSPYSLAFGSGILTSCSTRGLFVTIPVPLGRKSFPTTASSTELFPELCNHRKATTQTVVQGISLGKLSEGLVKNDNYKNFVSVEQGTLSSLDAKCKPSYLATLLFASSTEGLQRQIPALQ